MLGLEEISMRWHFQFTAINISDIHQLEVKGMTFVREMLHNNLKFPEFEVVTWKALIWRSLV